MSTKRKTIEFTLVVSAPTKMRKSAIAAEVRHAIKTGCEYCTYDDGDNPWADGRILVKRLK